MEQHGNTLSSHGSSLRVWLCSPFRMEWVDTATGQVTPLTIEEFLGKRGSTSAAVSARTTSVPQLAAGAVLDSTDSEAIKTLTLSLPLSTTLHHFWHFMLP